MQIQQIDDKNLWTNVLFDLNKNTFLQSWGWVDFNQKYGNKTWTFGLYEDDQLVSTAFVFRLDAKRGRFLFCPHGPQSQELDPLYLEAWTNYLRDLAKQEKCAFVRMSPIFSDKPENRYTFKSVGYRESPIHMHAELTTVLDISGTEEEVKKRIKKNARYDLRKAEELYQKGELTVELVEEITDEMYEVYRETFTRGAFVPFSQKYIQQEYQSFNENGDCVLINIRYQGELISWGLVLFFGKRAFYHQGANVLVKGVPAPTLLQWTGIQLARKHGCESYDFWGVAPKDQPKHPWASISRFKRSFGGDEVAYLPAQDLVVNPFMYFFTWSIEKFRRWKRGF